MIAENQPPQSFERPESTPETLTSTLKIVSANVIALRRREPGLSTQEMPA